MKDLFLILCCLITLSNVQKVHGMGGAVCGMIIPTLISPCYMAGTPGSVKKKMWDLALLTMGNALAGGAIHTISDALFGRTVENAPAVALLSIATSCGITIIWALEKTVPKAHIFSNAHSKYRFHPIEEVLPTYNKTS